LIIQREQKKHVFVHAEPSITETIKRKKAPIFLTHIRAAFEHCDKSGVIVERGDFGPPTFEQWNNLDLFLKIGILLIGKGVKNVQAIEQSRNF
jgi:hypothetical protein